MKIKYLLLVITLAIFSLLMFSPSIAAPKKEQNEFQYFISFAHGTGWGSCVIGWEYMIETETDIHLIKTAVQIRNPGVGEIAIMNIQPLPIK